MRRLVRCLPCALLLALVCAHAGAQQPAESPQPVSGVPEVADPVVDPDFGVSVDALGLRREVQMWQWRREGAGFAGHWSEAMVDSSGFPDDHTNPGEPPYGSAQWLAGQAQLDGRRLAPELLATLDGWELLSAGEAASKLPPNLAMVFQPETGWLQSSADPGAPDIGDLRLRWWRLPIGPVHGLLQADGQRWQLAEGTAGLARGEADDADPAGSDPVPGLPGREPGGGMMLLGWLLLAFMLIGGLVLYRRRH
jgi:hypothetical protein